MYRITYTDWKGRPSVTHVCAMNLQEAKEFAMVMQGMYRIDKIERVSQ